MKENAELAELGKDKNARTGMYTTTIMAKGNGRRIALFFTSRRHAGENFGRVLSERESGRAPPTHMCDALSRNAPKSFKVILANCVAHARRRYVDVASSFPTECEYVLDTLEKVYIFDDIARKQGMSPEERLAFHRANSATLMDDLKAWCETQFEKKLVEPNSGLGDAISYMLEHWKELTLFLRRAGAPIDNNIAERALKKAILHRKNSLFYKTEHGALVGDTFMTLIYTATLNGVNPHDYITELLRHFADVHAHPENWLPWNYKATLVGLSN
jgi:hypothetical protein